MMWLERIVGPDDTSASVTQLCIRAVILFFYGLLCLRIAGRRTFSSLSPLDIFVALVVGSNISRAMTGNVPFVATLAATLVLVILHRLGAMATVWSNPLALFIKGRPAVLIRNGEIDRRAMLRHGISDQDLMEGLRMEQVASVSDVALGTLERGGKLSVILKAPEG